jgi:urea transport system permease protein
MDSLNPSRWQTLYGTRGWTLLAGFCALSMLVIPLLNLGVSADSALHVSDYSVTLVGKIMCYAIVALALDLIWGYTGILSLGHGVFFALGGYAMGMYLMQMIAGEGQYGSACDWQHAQLLFLCFQAQGSNCAAPMARPFASPSLR